MQHIATPFNIVYTIQHQSSSVNISQQPSSKSGKICKASIHKPLFDRAAKRWVSCLQSESESPILRYPTCHPTMIRSRGSRGDKDHDPKRSKKLPIKDHEVLQLDPAIPPQFLPQIWLRRTWFDGRNSRHPNLQDWVPWLRVAMVPQEVSYSGQLKFAALLVALKNPIWSSVEDPLEQCIKFVNLPYLIGRPCPPCRLSLGQVTTWFDLILDVKD